MKLHKVNSTETHDFYKGVDKLEKRPIYNIVRKGDYPPRDGFFSAEYVARKHNTLAKHFFSEKE